MLQDRGSADLPPGGSGTQGEPVFWGTGLGPGYVPQITDNKQKPHSKFKKGEQSRLLLGGGVLGECCVPNTSPKPASVPAEG